METWLQTVRVNIETQARLSGGTEYSLDLATLTSCMRRGKNVGSAMEYILATGNIVSKTGLGLMQTTGLTVVADKLNFFRFISHFRCVHRGAFFAEMRTTAVRKLLPEAFGEKLPDHTSNSSNAFWPKFREDYLIIQRG